MSVLRSVLTRAYTCLVLQRTEACAKIQNQNYHDDSEMKKTRLTAAKRDRQMEKSLEITVGRQDLLPGVAFPTKETHATLIEGVRYDQLPIVHLRSTKNNTIASCDKYNGGGIAQVSCGALGFKCARKGTTVAAQAVGASLGEKLKLRDVTHVRVLMRGLGQGRMYCLRGLQMSGINIVSITDNNPLYTGSRPPGKRMV